MYIPVRIIYLLPKFHFRSNSKDPMTESITIGVMRKDIKNDLPEMKGLKMCNGGVDKLSGFLHPMGWLMANGTVPRRPTPLESIGLVHYLYAIMQQKCEF